MRDENVKRKLKWTEEGKERFRDKMERVWKKKEIEGREGWELLKKEMQRILQKEQRKEGVKRVRGWWDEECRHEKNKKS